MAVLCSVKKYYEQYFHQFVAALIVSMSAIATGTVLGWTAPAGPQLITNVFNYNNTLFSPLKPYNFKITNDNVSWFAAIMGLGGAIMCIPVGIFVRIWGCKKTLLFLILPITIGWLLIITAQNFVMLLIGRFLTGMSAGSFLIGIAVYIGEISSKEIRGVLGSFLQLFLNFGMLFVYAVGNYCNVPTLSLICATVPLLFGLAFIFMPETPYFLIAKNNPEEAKRSLQWFRTKKDYNVENEIADIQSQLNNLQINKNSLWKALSKRSSIKTLAIGIGLMFGLQMSGINVIQFYVTDIFIAAQINIEPGIATIIIGVMQTIATVTSVFLVDRLGRKLLLIISISAITICNIILGLYFYYQNMDGSGVIENFSWVPVVTLSLFVIMFNIGYGPIPWVMLGEIFSPDIKEFGSSVSTTVNWLLGFTVGLAYPGLSKVINIYGAFWFFAGFSFCIVLFSIFIVRETKGKSLEDIQIMFAKED